MSSTTTTQTQTRTRQNVLKDYELHHSPGASSASRGPASPARPQTTSQNPPNWDTTHRRVPPYRPLNTDPEHQREVRTYNNAAERVFVGVMFTGVLINSTAAKVWRASAGRLNDGIFKYAVGGEV